MQLIPFIAESAIDAVNQIRAQLGPDAVVVNVRQLPADGLARLWQKPKIEVLAYKPEPALRLDVVSPPLPEEQVPPPAPTQPPQTSANPSPEVAVEIPDVSSFKPATRRAGNSRWKIGAVLESSGFLPVFAERVIDQIQARHGTEPPPSFAEELALAREVLSRMWRPARPIEDGSDRPHVLVGPPGAGKTTCLCKWLTHAVLMEGKQVRVWRLDGVTANTAEALAIYCDVLGVPMERSWQESVGAGEEAGARMFLDYPGVDWRDAGAIREFGKQLARIGSPRIHLVLNAAYEVPILLAQARAFAALPVEDLVFSHLDEEARWGKLWQLTMGTNFPVRFLSAGQNIPGEFSVATAEKILSRQFSG